MFINEKPGKDVTDNEEGVVSNYESDANMMEKNGLRKPWSTVVKTILN